MRRGRTFDKQAASTIEKVLGLLGSLAPDLRQRLLLNLALLTVGMLQLWRGARSGNGWLTLCALARAMPLAQGFKACSKRLYRLLANPYVEGPHLTPLLVSLALGNRPPRWVPILVDLLAAVCKRHAHQYA